MSRQRRRLRAASTVIAIADAGVLTYGGLALASPRQLVPGYQRYTNRSWAHLMRTSPDTAAFILATFRRLGAMNIAAALPAIAIATTALREGRRWAWWTLFAVNTTGFGAPIVYDQMTGAIGPFERLEWFGLGCAVSLHAAALPDRSHRPHRHVLLAGCGSRKPVTRRVRDRGSCRVATA